MSSVNGVDDGVGYGVSGRSNRFSGVGVYGDSSSSDGVRGWSSSGDGVRGYSYNRSGVIGYSYGNGVAGFSPGGFGVYGSSSIGYGVYGESNSSYGVDGFSNSGDGVRGYSERGRGVVGQSKSFIGVDGFSNSSYGVRGVSNSGAGVYGSSTGSGYAAYLDGRVYIRGPLEKPAGSFKIDHPLDPANKYLSHSFVESPDMKNVYDGVVILDDKGEAEIELPDWFGALNKDFRYQLTAVGAPGPNLYIAEEISDGVTNHGNSSNKNNKSRFKIAGGTSGMKVSWQVTGIRQDPYAKAHPIQVEEDKPAKERGYYLYPDLYGQPAEKGISHLLFPEEEEKQELLLINEQNELT
jgi:hypothetical protein